VLSRQRGRRVLSGVAKRAVLDGHQNPHGLQPGDLRCGARRSRQSAGSGYKTADDPRKGHDIFTDAQAAIKRMGSEELGPSQMHALQARRHSWALWRARPDIAIKSVSVQRIRVSQGTRRPASGPRSRWRSQTPVGWNGYMGYSDRTEVRAMPFPRSPPTSSERSPAEARQWAGGGASRKKYKMPNRQNSDGSRQLQEVCLEVLPAEDRSPPHWEIPELDEEPTHRSVVPPSHGLQVGNRTVCTSP